MRQIGFRSWIMVAALVILTAGGARAELQGRLTEAASLRNDDRHDAQISTSLPRGTLVNITPELSSDRFFHVISLRSGRAGWVPRAAVSHLDGTSFPGAHTVENRADAASVATPRPSPRIVEVATARSQDTPVSEILISLISSGAVEGYLDVINDEEALTDKEKFLALKIYHRYLQDQRTQLGASRGRGETVTHLEEESQRLLGLLEGMNQDAVPVKVHARNTLLNRDEGSS